MKIGIAIPNIGPVATPEAVKTVAQQAEALGYHSLWTVERLLWPVNPKSPYPATPDGSLPEQYKYCLDPLDTLTFAAAHTSTIKLGTSVLDIPYYNPVLLARRLSTIDVLSKGRLRVGFGVGWSPDEMEAAGADMKVRGARADEFLQVLKTIWTTDPAEHHGKFFSLPKSYVGPKPLQKPHPPIFLAAYTPPAMKRVATMADGWNPAGVPIDGMAQMFGAIRQMAKGGTRSLGAEDDRARQPVHHGEAGGERPIRVRRFAGPDPGRHRSLREDRRRRGVPRSRIHAGWTVVEQLAEIVRGVPASKDCGRDLGLES